MIAIANNIINELNTLKKESYTKEEIINIVKHFSTINNLPIIESNGVTINFEKYLVTFDGVNHILPKKEFQLLYYLISNKNKIMIRDNIIRDVWGDDICIGYRTIDVHIRKIRRKINNPSLMTIKGHGYIWREK